jgi:Zn-dependent protease with chaperone function
MSKETLQKNFTLPPWLWFWLILYLSSFYTQVDFWKSYARDLSYYTPDLLTLSNFPELLPSIALFLGVITVFFPRIRAISLERRFKLVEIDSTFVELPERIRQITSEVEEFVKLHAPRLQIKVNFSLFDHNCFLYASGYSKTSIAIFGGILLLWRSDRKVAESIILHEIGHYRNGDALIIGAGSLFEWVLKHCLTITSFFFIIPTILVLANQQITFFYDSVHAEIIFLDMMKDTGMTTKEIIFNFLNQFSLTIVSVLKISLLSIPTLLFTMLWLLILTISTFIPAIAGIWCAELNADRFMTETSDSPEAPVRALNRITENVSIFRWMLSQASHPPRWFRKWAVKDTKKAESMVVFLLLFPFSYFIRLIEPFIRTFTYTVGIREFTNTLEVLDISTGMSLQTVYTVWFLSAFFILLWPVIAVHWVKLFSGENEISNLENYNQYILSAGILFFLFAVAYLIA